MAVEVIPAPRLLDLLEITKLHDRDLTAGLVGMVTGCGFTNALVEPRWSHQSNDVRATILPSGGCVLLSCPAKVPPRLGCGANRRGAESQLPGGTVRNMPSLISWVWLD